MDNLNIYFVIWLLIAAMIMGCLAMATCLQVFRLRNKRLAWRAGTLKGFPLFSTLFLSISVVLTVVIGQTGGVWKIVVSGVYLFFSVSWFVSSYFSSKRYITDHGIVKNINDTAQTVAWHQIYDFFEKQQDGGSRYIFIYKEKQEDAPEKMERLTLVVPEKHHPAFKQLLSHKLGRRISCYDDETIDIKNFQ